MGYFTFARKSTGEVWEDQCSIAEMEARLAADKDLDVIPAAVPQGDGYRLGVWKPPNISQWRDVLTKVHKGAGKKSNVNIP